MLCERHARLSLFLTRDYAGSARKDNEILENNNGKKLKEDPLFFLLSSKGSPGKSGLDLSMTETRTSNAKIAQGSGFREEETVHDNNENSNN